jgi:chromate transporter
MGHAKNQPKSLTEFFWAITLLALQGFGGVFPVARRVLVDERQWIDDQEFLEDWAVAQVLPGPNIVNLSVMLGGRVFGVKGAITAVFGLFFFPSVLLILIAIFFEQFRQYPAVSSALQGMGAVSAGLIAGTSLKLASGLKDHPLTLPIAITITLITFSLLALTKLSLIFVLLIMGTSSIILTYLRIKQARKMGTSS